MWLVIGTERWTIRVRRLVAHMQFKGDAGGMTRPGVPVNSE